MKTFKLLFLVSLFLLASVLPGYAVGPMPGMLSHPFVCGDSISFLGITYSTVTALDTECWLAQNLGAPGVATSETDSTNYGKLWQWGRLTDGHEVRTSGTTTTQSSADSPGHANFIYSSSDWRNPANDNLWQGLAGTNNPCPSGFRIPTQAEWAAVVSAETITNSASAYGSTLKLTMGGYRATTDATVINADTNGYYWSSTVSAANANDLYFTAATANAADAVGRANGASIRCIKD